jgi:alpha-glucuronidase
LVEEKAGFSTALRFGRNDKFFCGGNLSVDDKLSLDLAVRRLISRKRRGFSGKVTWVESKQPMRFCLSWIAAVGLACVSAGCVAQAVLRPAWLQYAIPPDPPRYHDMPHAVVQLGYAVEEDTAADELDRGLGHMVAGTDHLLRRFDPRLDSIVMGTTDMLRRVRPVALVDRLDPPLPEDGYRIRRVRSGPRQWWVLEGGSPRGELYAAFRFAALVAEDRQLPERLVETAKIPLRAIDLRGDLRELPADGGLPVLGQLMASVGLNGLVVDEGTMPSQSVVAAMRPFGIRVWFRGAQAELVAGIAGAAGVAIPARGDLKRLAAAVQEANAAARVLRRRGGSVLLEDAPGPGWKTAGVDGSPEQRVSALHGLEPNVVLANDAVPTSLPLAGLASSSFGLMPSAAQMAAFRLFPMGERSVVFPAAVWASVLATPERSVRSDGTLAEVVARKSDAGMHGGVVASLTVPELVAMMRQPLMQANLFGFGRVAWNSAEKPEDVADAWARQTFGDDARVFGVAKGIVVGSAEAMVHVSSPFGLDWLGEEGRPDPSRASHRAGVLADAQGIGVDRTGELARYPAPFAAELADVSRCPERWLLAVHRVSPSQKMANGKSVVQAFYDVHFSGAAQMFNALDAWDGTKDLVDGERFAAVHEMLSSAARHGEVWRDTTTEWMERVTGVIDEPRFVGNHPGRVEAESMSLTGFAVARVEAAEDASGGAYVACGAVSCSAETVFHGEANVYRIETGYFAAVNGGELELRVNGTIQAHWTVEKEAGEPGAAVAERFVVNGVRLKPGDSVAVVGNAAVDFAEVTRDPRWN